MGKIHAKSRVLSVSTETNAECRNCGAQMAGRFCSSCGEKRLNEHDKSVKHLFHDAFHFLTHFEGSFFNTVRTVFTRPGKYALDYSNGIRKKYFKPVNFLLLLVVLYLIFPRFKGLNMQLYSLLMPEYGYSWIATPLVQTELKEKTVTINQLIERYDARSPTVSKVAIFAMLPLCALTLTLLFFYRKRYFYDHFILGIELVSFHVSFQYLLIPFLSFLTEKIYPPGMVYFSDSDGVRELIEIVVDILFTTVALSRFYSQKWYATLPQAIAYLAMYQMIVFYLYRTLVLLVTMYLI